VTAPTAATTVALYVWRLPRRRIPVALCRIARDRARLRRLPGVLFGKILGTGAGRTLSPGRADLTRWTALVVFDGRAAAARFGQSPVARAWHGMASTACRVDLRPVSWRGSWSGFAEFGAHPADPAAVGTSPGLCCVITRARLRPARAVRFWRAIDPVATAAAAAPGLVTMLGVGEAPLGWQGTVSFWRDSREMMDFAYRHPEHRRVIEKTTTGNWYAEQLFARFEVLDIVGDRHLLDWPDEGGAGPDETGRLDPG
jgi:hypothetical protein